MSLASVAFDNARTLLNDDGIQLWTDDALKAKLQQAHRELQVQLRANACPVTRTTQITSVFAFSTTLSNPSDIIEPITLWEKDPQEPDGSYVRMTEYDPLPITNPIDRLVWWRWAVSNFEFIGCSRNRMVKILYKRMLVIPNLGTDDIGIVDGENYIGPRTAALASPLRIFRRFVIR